MESAKIRNYRVDFTRMHWCGSGTNLMSKIAKLEAFRYHTVRIFRQTLSIFFPLFSYPCHQYGR